MTSLWRRNSLEFEPADDGVEGAALGRRPEQRRDLARARRVEPQVLVHRDLDQRGKVEHPGDRIGGRHEVGRRLGIEPVPVGRQHGGGEMAAGGMAVDHHALAGALPEKQQRVPHLLDDVVDRDLRAEIVAGDRDRDAVGVEPARHVAEQRRIERAPIAAMDEQSQRRLADFAGGEQVDELARRRAVVQPELGAALLHRLPAVILGLSRPAREDLRVLRHPRAVVVLGLVVDRRHSRLPIRQDWASAARSARARFVPAANRVMRGP